MVDPSSEEAKEMDDSGTHDAALDNSAKASGADGEFDQNAAEHATTPETEVSKTNVAEAVKNGNTQVAAPAPGNNEDGGGNNGEEQIRTDDKKAGATLPAAAAKNLAPEIESTATRNASEKSEATKKKKKSTYDSILIHVKLANVRPLKNLVRSTSVKEDLVNTFVDRLEDGDYPRDGQYITVGFEEMDKADTEIVIKALRDKQDKYDCDYKDWLSGGKDEQLKKAFNIVENLDLWYCDGMHRGGAIIIIQTRGKVVPSNLKFPLVKLVFRRDMLPMSALDMQGYGSARNQVASSVVVMTKHHHLHNTVSLIRNLEKARKMTPAKRKIEEEKFGDSEEALEAFKRYTAESNTKKEIADLVIIGTFYEVLNGKKKAGEAKKYCIAATGLTAIAGENLEDQNKLLGALENINNMDVLGCRQLWGYKSVTCQVWLIEHFKIVINRLNKPASKGSSSRSKAKKKPTRESIPDVLLRVWNAFKTVTDEVGMTEEAMLELKYKDGKQDETVKGRLTRWVENQPLHEWPVRGNNDTKWANALRPMIKRLRKGSEVLETLSPAEKAKQTREDNEEKDTPKDLGKKVDENDGKKKEDDSGNQHVDGRGEDEKDVLETPQNNGDTNEQTGKTDSDGNDEGKATPAPDMTTTPDAWQPDEPGIEGGQPEEPSPKRKLRNRGAGGKRPKYTDDDEVEPDTPVSTPKETPKKAVLPKGNPPTYPPGYKDFKGLNKVKNQLRAWQPFWSLKDPLKNEPFKLSQPWGDKKQLVPGAELRDNDGFQIYARWNGRRGILFHLPEPRNGGWKTVTWTGGKDVTTGEYAWKEGTYVPIGSKDKQLVMARLMEDYQNNWVLLKEPFVMDKEPQKYAIEYDFIRNPPVPSKVYNPEPRPQRVLRCMGFRPPNRAMFHITMKDILEIRNHMGAHFLRTETPKLCHAADIMKKGGTPAREHADATFSEKFLNMFRDYRTLLDSRGYIVFDNIMNPIGAEDAEQILGFESLKDTQPVGAEWKKYADFYEKYAPTNDEMKKDNVSEQAYDLFSVIRDDNGQDEDGNTKTDYDIKRGVRLTTRRRAVTDMFEEMSNEDKGLMLMRAKLKKEVMLMQLLHWLRVEEHTFDASSPPTDINSTAHADNELLDKRRNVPRIYCPDTGSRIIMNSSKDGAEQVPHIDFCIPEGSKLAKDGSLLYPPYFAEVTSRTPTPLWVVHGSHRRVGLPEEDRDMLGKIDLLKLIYLPSWSIFISRGDIKHAGGSGKLASNFGEEEAHCTRGHLYAGRIGIGLPDSINDDHCQAYTHSEEDKEIKTPQDYINRLLAK